MLSKNERSYLQGKLKPKPNPNYKRRLHHDIKLNVIQALEDFPLLLKLPEKKQINLFCDDKLVGEAIRAIQLMWLKAQEYLDAQGRLTFHAKRIGRLEIDLGKAGIQYDTYKLSRDGDYRAQKGRELKRKKLAINSFLA